MKKTEFIQLIQNPEQLAANHVAALKQMVIDFPYNAHARVLLAKALFNEKHYDYEKFLKQTALVVPDRDVLYHYLHSLIPQWQLPQQHIVVTPPAPVVSASNNNEIDEVKIVVENILEMDEISEAVFATIDEPKVEEVIAKAEEDLEVQQTKDELDVDLAISNLLEETQVTSPIVEEVTPIEALVDIVEPKNVTSCENQEEELSFVEWLQRKNNPKPKTESKLADEVRPQEMSVNNEEEVDKVAEIIEEHVAVNKLEPEQTVLPTTTIEVTKEQIEQAVAKSNINDFHNILDRFIKENPSISRPKAEFFNPVNMARQSVEEDEELVTETLASLFYKQGNHKKAIRAYEKLCLLYPSKMSYFASLIQKIKTEIKD
jgi:tetratricopeptide (TPR) repeat protein